MTFSTYTALFVFLVLVLDALAISAVLSGRGSARHKAAWVAAIVFLPVAGLILYFLFGRKASDESLLP